LQATITAKDLLLQIMIEILIHIETTLKVLHTRSPEVMEKVIHSVSHNDEHPSYLLVLLMIFLSTVWIYRN